MNHRFFKIITFKAFLFLFFLFVTKDSFALSNAKVLPKNIFYLTFSNEFMNIIDSKYNSSGQKERFDAPLNLNLDGNTLAEFEQRVNELIATINELTGDRREGDKLNAGSIETNIEGMRNTHTLSLNYGVTDKLSIRVAAPIVKTEISLKSNFKHNNSIQNLRSKYPEQKKLTEALDELAGVNTQTFMNYLADLGYDPIDGYDETSIGDVSIGGKYRYLKNRLFEFAFGCALIAPTGKKHDPDMLIQAPPGSGTWGIALSTYHDYKPACFINNNLTIQYLKLLPDSEEMRVIETRNSYLSPRKEQINRSPGDAMRLIFSNTFSMTKNFYFDLSYIFSAKGEDKYSTSDGSRISAMEKDTSLMLHETELMLGYNTIADYRNGSSVPPYEMELAYRRSLAGKNVPYANAITFNLGVYF